MFLAFVAVAYGMKAPLRDDLIECLRSDLRTGTVVAGKGRPIWRLKSGAFYRKQAPKSNPGDDVCKRFNEMMQGNHYNAARVASNQLFRKFNQAARMNRIAKYHAQISHGRDVWVVAKETFDTRNIFNHKEDKDIVFRLNTHYEIFESGRLANGLDGKNVLHRMLLIIPADQSRWKLCYRTEIPQKYIRKEYHNGFHILNAPHTVVRVLDNTLEITDKTTMRNKTVELVQGGRCGGLDELVLRFSQNHSLDLYNELTRLQNLSLEDKKQCVRSRFKTDFEGTELDARKRGRRSGARGGAGGPSRPSSRRTSKEEKKARKEASMNMMENTLATRNGQRALVLDDIPLPLD